MKYECYVCGRKEEDKFLDNVLRRPVGWGKDSLGHDRCPKHVLERAAFATLGDALLTKRDKWTL